MKKSLIITIAAALLLAAVLCTAGCVDAPSDPIVGSWVAETDTSSTFAVFENDGTGLFAESTEAAAEPSVLMLDWKANGDTTYAFLFEDGTAKTASLNAEHGLLTVSDGSVLEKQMHALSGAAVGMTPGQKAGWALEYGIKMGEKKKVAQEIVKLQGEKKQLEEMKKQLEEKKKKQLEEKKKQLERIDKQLERIDKQLEEKKNQLVKIEMRLDEVKKHMKQQNKEEKQIQ